MRYAIVNQVCGAMFCDLIERIAELGPTTVYTGEIERDIPNVTVALGPRFDRNSALNRVRSWWLFTRWAMNHAAAFDAGTRCLVTSNPPFAPLIAARGKRTGARVMALMWDIYPEAFEQLRGIKKTSALSRYVRRINKKGLQECDQVITISEQMRVVLEQYKPFSSPIEVIPTWVDTKTVLPVDRPQSGFAAKHEVGDSLVVMYAGNVGEVHDLSALPQASRLLKGRDDIRLFVIGGGSGYESLRQACFGTDVVFLPTMGGDEFLEAIGTADVSLVALAPRAHGISMPSKCYYAMAAGSAVCGICSEKSDLAATILENDCGFIVDPSDGADLAEKLIALVGDRSGLERWKSNARQAAVTRYDADRVCAEIIQMVSG